MLTNGSTLVQIEGDIWSKNNTKNNIDMHYELQNIYSYQKQLTKISNAFRICAWPTDTGAVWLMEECDTKLCKKNYNLKYR